MCGALKKVFPMGGLSLASHLFKHSPAKKIMPKPVEKAAKFVGKGGALGAIGRSLFGD